MRLDLTQQAAAPRAVVWDVLTRWEGQSDWMLDAKAVHVTSAHRTGLDVEILCPTNLFGLTVQDRMRVTGWDEPRYLEVTHLGRIITGTGAFELTELSPDRTRIDWWEEVDPPLGAFGEFGARLVVLPFVRRLFRRSLANLAALAEAEVGRRGPGPSSGAGA